MKRFLCVLLAGTMVFSLAACGGQKTPEVQPTVPIAVLEDPSSFAPALPDTVQQDMMLQAAEDELIKQDLLMMDKIVKMFEVTIFHREWSWSYSDNVIESNFSCYSDSQVTKADKIEDSLVSWRYHPDSVKADGELYIPDGYTSGLTLTFFPSRGASGTEFKLSDVRVNEMVQGYYTDEKASKSLSFKEMDAEIYEFFSYIFGESLPIKSQTYKNSSFTVFINTNMDEDEAVYGMWNGTNIPTDEKYDATKIKESLKANYENESSWQKKDSSAMNEVENAMKLAMADQDVYDEMLAYVCSGNVSCYIDTPFEEEWSNYKIVTKEADGKADEEYIFDETVERAKGFEYYPAGNMTGVTLTFEPKDYKDNYTFYIGDVIINKYVRDDAFTTADRAVSAVKYLRDEPDYNEFGLLSNTSSGRSWMYNKLRAVIGDYICISSRAYRDSDYTIFMNFDMSKGRPLLHVYGQWSKISGS